MIKKIIVVVSIMLLWTTAACADFSFRGSANLLTKELNLELNIPDNGIILFRGVNAESDTVDFDLTVHDLKVFVFDISTALSGTARIIERPNAEPFIRGSVGRDERNLKADEGKHVSLGTFEFKDDKFFLDPISFKGMTARGNFFAA